MRTAESANIGLALTLAAERRPDGPALVFVEGGRERSLTFRELDALSNRLASGLEARGVRRGARAVVMVRPGPEFFGLAFALFKVGAVPVLIDPGMGRASLGRCLEEARPEAFIGIPLAQAARLALGWGRETLRTVVTVGPKLLWGGSTYADLVRDGDPKYQAAETESGETAAILFTSGSTGAPKGAVYTHGAFASQVELLRERFAIEAGGVDVPTFPLFALFDPALGLTAVLPEMDFTRPGAVSPEKIFGAIERHRATQMFGSPALLDALSRVPARPRLGSLRLVLSAGAPLAPRIAERFAALLPETARFFTAYGATEALPVSAIEAREILSETRHRTAEGRGVCVGRPFPGIEVRIAKISDEPLPDWTPDAEAGPGEIGEVVVRGPVVTRAYFGRPSETASAKIRFQDGGLGHRMGDLGTLDAGGRLWLCGRKSHRVETSGGTLFTLPCEGLFNRHPKVRRTALVGVGRPPAQRPVLCVELEAGVSASTALRHELLALADGHEAARGVRDLLFHPAFPVDIRHNAKIFREKLAEWAERELP